MHAHRQTWPLNTNQLNFLWPAFADPPAGGAGRHKLRSSSHAVGRLAPVEGWWRKYSSVVRDL